MRVRVSRQRGGNLQGLGAAAARHGRHSGRRLPSGHEARRGGLEGAVRLLLRRPQAVKILSSSSGTKPRNP